MSAQTTAVATTAPRRPQREESTSDVYQRIKWNGWGTAHKWMRLDDSDRTVVLHANGAPIRGLIPFIQNEIGVTGPLKATPSMTLEEVVQRLPAPVLNQAFLKDLRAAWSAPIRTDGEARVTHAFGKNYRDLWRVRRAMLDRVPDVVVLPQSHEDCVILMTLAVKHDVAIIPYGGGTNVTGCVEASPFESRRMVVSVDLRRMNRLIRIDTVSRTATFEAGILGPDVDEQLGRHGMMLGHDPDSYIHSTLGGWIAARSSGAMSNAYGDIEQMVLSLRIVTPQGTITTPLTARPVGPDLNGMFIGSEGCFGIITEATVKTERIPPVKHYEGWLFPTFEAGFEAHYQCTQNGIHPTCMRLYDEDDTRMSLALRTDSPPLQAVASKVIRQYLSLRGWQLSRMAMCIVGFEGDAASVAFERKRTAAVYRTHGGFAIGQGAGANWQHKKYDLPFVRDFALGHGLWADVFETAVLYTEAVGCWRAVKEAVRAVWAKRGQKGWIGCHSAHQYRMGCCLYFTYAGQQVDANDLDTFVDIKTAAMEAMLRHQGNLSHHHGIGYEHVPWMARYLSSPTLELLLSFKKTVDPTNICNPGKLLPEARKSGETDADVETRRRRAMMFDKMGRPSQKSKL